MTRFLILVSVLCFLNGCSRVAVYSPAEQESGYTYVPLDPFPVKAVPRKGCSCLEGTELSRATLLQALPDNAVRMLIEQFDAKGKVSYGPSQVLGQGASYRVTIDYIYSDTKNQSIFVSKSVFRPARPDETHVYINDKPVVRTVVREVVPINASPAFSYVPGSEEYKVTRQRPSLERPANYRGEWSENDALARRNQNFAAVLSEYAEIKDKIYLSLQNKMSKESDVARLRMDDRPDSPSVLSKAEQELKEAEEKLETLDTKRRATEKRILETKGIAYGEFQKESESFDKEYTEFNIPIYVGLGLRTSSIIYAVKGEANISGLGVIGAEAEANNLKGSLIIQTLGVNGKSVAAALPIQSELNRTTAQNAIVAIGTIKALLHSPETWIAPRVVGLYLPFPGGKALVNALVSELSTHEIEWEYSCPKAEDSKAKGNNTNSVAGPNQ